MNSDERSLFAAIDVAIRATHPSVEQPVPGQWRVDLSPAWGFGLAVSTSGRASSRRARATFLVFSEEIQRSMDRFLQRPFNPRVATLTFTPLWAREFLATSVDVIKCSDFHDFQLGEARVVASAIIEQYQTLGLPTGSALASPEAIIRLHRHGRLSEVCLPSDYVASCALLLSGQGAEAKIYVERRVADLLASTTDAALEPFLEFGPRLLTALRHDA